MSERSAVVFGGAGFIGAKVCERLVASGVSLTCVDWNLGHVAGVNYVIGSIADGSLLDSVLKPGIDVYHFAYSGVPVSDELWRSNIQAVSDLDVLCNYCAQHNCRLVFPSSGGTIYGNAIENPIKEECPLQPISGYGFVKLLQESVIQHSARTKGLRYVILRIANCYGPGYQIHKPQGIVGHAIACCMMRQPIPIIGDGLQERDFVFVEDVARLCVAVNFDKEVYNQIINVGTGIGTPILEVLQRITGWFGGVPAYVKLPPRTFDVKTNVLDISKAKKLLGWEPVVYLDEGVQLTCSIVTGRSYGGQIATQTVKG